MSQATVKQAIEKMAESVQKAPERAVLTYRAQTHWDENCRCISKVRKFDPVVVDEPASFGGGDSAQSPADLILTALGTCQEIMFSALASVMDIKLDECRVDLKGHLDLHGLLGLGKDKGIPAGFLDIEYTTYIKSPDTEERLKALVNAVEEQCPILDTLKRNIDIKGTAVINGSSYSSDAA